MRNSVTGIMIATSVCLITLAGCATVYTEPTFATYKQTHKKVAVVPFQVSITLNKLPDGLTYEALKEMEVNEGYEFQSELITSYLRRAAKGEYTVEFQDAAMTNALLKQAGLSYDDVVGKSKDELAKILGVDAVISGRINRSKPMSTGAAVAAAILIGYSATNEVSVNMNIHDGASSKLLWNFDHEITGALGSTPSRIAELMTRKSAKRFPYKR